jgi:hypothetical protein
MPQVKRRRRGCAKGLSLSSLIEKTCVAIWFFRRLFHYLHQSLRQRKNKVAAENSATIPLVGEEI